MQLIEILRSHKEEFFKDAYMRILYGVNKEVLINNMFDILKKYGLNIKVLKTYWEEYYLVVEYTINNIFVSCKIDVCNYNF